MTVVIHLESKILTHKMGKLMKMTDYLLLFAAIGGDLLEEIKLGLDIRPEILKARYGFIPAGFKRSNYISTVSKMMSIGDINKKIDSTGQPYLELTSVGTKKFRRRFPLLSLKRKTWDGTFMVVIFDIPEVDRDDRYIIRKKLEALGFAMLQESVWISPYHFEEDLREFFVQNGFSNKVFLMEAKNLYAGGLKEIVTKIWKLDNLNTNYQQIVDRVRKLSSLELAEKDKETRSILGLYLETIRNDPFLPEEIDNSYKLRHEAGFAIKVLF